MSAWALEYGFLAATIMAVGYLTVTALVRIYRAAPYLFHSGAVGRLEVVPGGLVVAERDGDRRLCGWAEVRSVVIETTADGPLGEDLFWVITLEGAATPIRVPGGAPAAADFLATAPDHLAGFDHDAVIEAAGSTEAARFLVFSRPPLA